MSHGHKGEDPIVKGHWQGWQELAPHCSTHPGTQAGLSQSAPDSAQGRGLTMTTLGSQTWSATQFWSIILRLDGTPDVPSLSLPLCVCDGTVGNSDLERDQSRG